MKRSHTPRMMAPATSGGEGGAGEDEGQSGADVGSDHSRCEDAPAHREQQSCGEQRKDDLPPSRIEPPAPGGVQAEHHRTEGQQQRGRTLRGLLCRPDGQGAKGVVQLGRRNSVHVLLSHEQPGGDGHSGDQNGSGPFVRAVLPSRKVVRDPRFMGGHRAIGWRVAGVVVGCLPLIGGAVLFATGQVPGPVWATAAVGGMVAVLVVPGKKAAEALGARWAAPIERSTLRSSVLGRAPRVADAQHRMALSIHTAIPLPEGADPGLSGSLPEYISRGIDPDVRAWIKGHTKSGGLVVLVGAAAAGKTRSLYEALRAEVPDWRMPDVVTGTQLNSLVADGTDLSRSVIWLDELQNFFADDVLTAGSVRQLVLGRHGPVLLAATIRAEELDRLLLARSSGSGEERTGVSRPVGDQHAQEVVKMLARWSPRSAVSERAIRFHVDSRLTGDELARARELAEIDPCIARALHGTEEGRITATLAGAPDLIERWTRDTAEDPAGQAVITAAVIARRCGHPELIPSGVLGALALLLLAQQSRVPLTAEWLPAALDWAQSPIKGTISALRRSATQPGVVYGFRVSDVLLQYSYDEPDENLVAPLLARDETWATLLQYAVPSARTSVGVAAEEAGKAAIAVRA
ncbi:hypothetical protein [Streptomyces melanogenes]|uniref:hypothetical protein n=1 Tax=Streptomyces melanogenes TaxID=67326 RepID=UPI0037B0607E